MRKALPSLFPDLLGTTNSARVEFYDKFQHKAGDYDHDLMRKYDEDLNTTLIFVSIFSIYIGRGIHFFFRGARLVYSLQSHRLSFSIFRASSNRTSRK